METTYRLSGDHLRMLEAPYDSLLKDLHTTPLESLLELEHDIAFVQLPRFVRNSSGTVRKVTKRASTEWVDKVDQYIRKEDPETIGDVLVDLTDLQARDLNGLVSVAEGQNPSGMNLAILIYAASDQHEIRDYDAKIMRTATSKLLTHVREGGLSSYSSISEVIDVRGAIYNRQDS